MHLCQTGKCDSETQIPKIFEIGALIAFCLASVSDTSYQVKGELSHRVITSIPTSKYNMKKHNLKISINSVKLSSFSSTSTV